MLSCKKEAPVKDYLILSGTVDNFKKRDVKLEGFDFEKKIPFNKKTKTFGKTISGKIRKILTNDLCASAFCGNSIVRSHFANTSHWPLASLTMPARCLLCVRSVASFGFVVKHCACPTHPVRAQFSSPFLFKIQSYQFQIFHFLNLIWKFLNSLYITSLFITI